jgi:sarcosine oxidase gamma subunit
MLSCVALLHLAGPAYARVTPGQTQVSDVRCLDPDRWLISAAVPWF